MSSPAKGGEQTPFTFDGCPFCLRAIKGWLISDEQAGRYFIRCDHEDCAASGPIRDTPNGAREAWNRRGDAEDDVRVHREEYRGYEIEVYQDAETVGTARPTYFQTRRNLAVKSGTSAVSDSVGSVEEAVAEARRKVDRRIELKKRREGEGGACEAG